MSTLCGFVVMLVMQVVTGLAYAAQVPSLSGPIVGLISNMVYFDPLHGPSLAPTHAARSQSSSSIAPIRRYGRRIDALAHRAFARDNSK